MLDGVGEVLDDEQAGVAPRPGRDRVDVRRRRRPIPSSTPGSMPAPRSRSRRPASAAGSATAASVQSITPVMARWPGRRARARRRDRSGENTSSVAPAPAGGRAPANALDGGDGRGADDRCDGRRAIHRQAVVPGLPAAVLDRQRDAGAGRIEGREVGDQAPDRAGERRTTVGGHLAAGAAAPAGRRPRPVGRSGDPPASTVGVGRGPPAERAAHELHHRRPRAGPTRPARAAGLLGLLHDPGAVRPLDPPGHVVPALALDRSAAPGMSGSAEQAVAEAADGDDQPRVVGVVLDLHPQAPHVGVDEPRVAEVLVPPHPLQQLVPGEHAIRRGRRTRTAGGTRSSSG